MVLDFLPNGHGNTNLREIGQEIKATKFVQVN
jgi:hypothetical protein